MKRNNGIGTKMIDYIGRLYCKDIFAVTDDDAIGFYKRYGFKIENKVNNYNGKEVTRYICWKKREES